MSKLIDLGSVSEETKGSKYSSLNHDAAKEVCQNTPSVKYYAKANTGSDDWNSACPSLI